MAAKKRARKANPKRRSGGRKNPWLIDGKRYYEDDEIDLIRGAADAEIKKSAAAPQPKMSSYSKADLAILAAAGRSGYSPSQKKISQSAADKLIAKLDNDYQFASASEKAKIRSTKAKIQKMTQAPAAKPNIGQILKTKSEQEESSLLKSLLKGFGGRGSAAIQKKKKTGPATQLQLGVLDRDALLDIAQELKSGNPRKGGKKMAKKGRKKAAAAPKKRKKSKGKKVAKRKVGRKSKARKSSRKGKKARKSLRFAKATAKALSKAETAARKYLRSHKKAKLGPKRGRKVKVRYMRNPAPFGAVGEARGVGWKDLLKSFATVAGIGAVAGVGNKFAGAAVAKGLDMIGLGKLKDMKLGAVPVGGILVSSIAPIAMAVVAKKYLSKRDNDMADQFANVMLITTAANIGQRIMGSLPIPGLAGVEPMLMGVEPLLMGDADFGDADFGDADFGAIEQFSGVEPLLMGNADFGAIEQFSGEDADMLGAVQLHGDDYTDEMTDEEYERASHGLG